MYLVSGIWAWPLPFIVKIFADELNLYLAFDSLSPTFDEFANFQINIDQLVKYGAGRGFVMFADKYVAMRFASKSSTLPYSGLSPYKIND